MASTSDEIVNRYQCEICNHYYKTQKSLKNHYYVYHSGHIYKCTICEFTAYKKSYVDKHMISLHSEQKIRCTICEIDVNSKHEFIKHQSEHKSPTSSNEFICFKCYPTKTFTNFFALEKHDAWKHSFLFCNVCRKMFKYSVDLFVHMMNHSEKYPFQCDVCLKRYKLKDTCNKHIFIKHKLPLL